jgi:heterodisulfide reductase subunit A
VLASGMVPAPDTERLSNVLGVSRDVHGFIEILDRKNRATETSAEGIFVCGSAAGPKALVECNIEASAVASEIHNFLASSGRLTTPASEVIPERCIGCDTCKLACPFGAISLNMRPTDVARPSTVREYALLATIDQDACHACGICAVACPEMAIRHNLSDEVLNGRLRLLAEGIEGPVIGFYCRECAGAAISLSGMRHDSYPANVRLVELSCLGRISALHIIDAARLGARGIFLAGCAEGRCQFRKGDVCAAEQVNLARELLKGAGLNIPIELWHLCAVDCNSVGRRIRLFCALAHGKDSRQTILNNEARKIDDDHGDRVSLTTDTIGGNPNGSVRF